MVQPTIDGPPNPPSPDVAAAVPSSCPPPETTTIAFTSNKKKQAHFFEALLRAAADMPHISLVPLPLPADASSQFCSAPPTSLPSPSSTPPAYDAILYKRTDDMAAAATGGDAAAARRVRALHAALASPGPTGAPVVAVDPIAGVWRLVDRASISAAVESALANVHGVSNLPWASIGPGQARARKSVEAALAGLRFPIILKRRLACGSKASHEMVIAYDWDGIHAALADVFAIVVPPQQREPNQQQLQHQLSDADHDQCLRPHQLGELTPASGQPSLLDDDEDEDLRRRQMLPPSLRAPSIPTHASGAPSEILRRQRLYQEPYLSSSAASLSTSSSTSSLTPSPSSDDWLPAQCSFDDRHVIAQEYIPDHGGLVFKVYAVAEQMVVRPRASVTGSYDPSAARDGTYGAPLRAEGSDGYFKFDSQKINKDAVPRLSGVTPPPPPTELTMAVIRALGKELGLSLMGIDFVYNMQTQLYSVVDINYFPGYAGVPEIHGAILEHVHELVQKRRNGDRGWGIM